LLHYKKKLIVDLWLYWKKIGSYDADGSAQKRMISMYDENPDQDEYNEAEEYGEEEECEDGEGGALLSETKPVLAAADFFPDGKSLLTAGWDGVLAEWDADTGRRLRTLLDPKAVEDNNPRITATKERRDSEPPFPMIRLSDCQRGFPLPSVRFSPDGTLFAVGAMNGFIVVWNARSRGELGYFQPHYGGVAALAFSPGNRRLATGSRDWGGVTLRVWRMPNRPGGEFRQVFSNDTHAAGVRNLQFSPNGRFLAAIGVPLSSYTPPLVFTARTGRLKAKLEWDMSWAVEFSPRGRFLATGGEGGRIKIWEWKKGRIIREVPAHKEMVRTLAFTPDGRHLASGSADGGVRIWDVRTGRLAREFAVPGRVLACRFFEDGRVLRAAAAAEDADHPEVRRLM
jgi:WD40 repeat protein